MLVLEGVLISLKELEFEREPSAISSHIIVLNVDFFSRRH